MAAETMAIQVPQALYRRLERLADLTAQPLDRLIAQALSASLPLLPDDLPPAWRDALLALEGLDDAALERATLATFPEARHAQFAALRGQARDERLDPADQATLDRLAAEADLLTLRKAYAAVLLKWRGVRLPSWVAPSTP